MIEAIIETLAEGALYAVLLGSMFAMARRRPMARFISKRKETR